MAKPNPRKSIKPWTRKKKVEELLTKSSGEGKLPLNNSGYQMKKFKIGQMVQQRFKVLRTANHNVRKMLKTNKFPFLLDSNKKKSINRIRLVVL